MCVGVAFSVGRSQCQKRAPGAVSPWRARTVGGVSESVVVVYTVGVSE